MFPHACGNELERAVANGADPKMVVPDDYVILRGGTKPVPTTGEEFSCSTGPSTEAASGALPNNQVRATTVGAIRAAGGTVEWVPEFSPRGTMNKQHVHVTEAGPTAFGEPIPTPKANRIDGGR